MSVVAHTVPGSARAGLLDRFLRVFGEVRPGEGVTTTLMLVNIFMLLVCYSIIKTVREPLILLGGGAQVRSYSAAGQAVLLMAYVPFYSWFASRVDRVKLLVGVTLLFLVCIELFTVAVSARVPYVGVAFFIWQGIFNVSLVAQFWSFANDIYNKDAGNRLFPIITIGMTAGAPLGSFIAARLFSTGLGPQIILQVSAVLLLGTLGLYLAVNARERARSPRAETKLEAGNGFALVLRSPYLRLVALLIVLLNVVNSTGEFLNAQVAAETADRLAASSPGFNKEAFLGTYFGNYQLYVNIIALLLQAFIVSRLVKHFGLPGALVTLPLISLGGYSIVAAGALGLVRWVKTAENATDYSVMNTARQLLWLPTSREEKYKAKQTIDTFFMRGGDVFSALIVFLGTAVTLSTQQFAMANVILTCLWLGIAVLIVRHYRALETAKEPEPANR